MTKFIRVAIIFAIAVLIGAVGAVVEYWLTNDDTQLVWKNGTNEPCWRDTNWTPAATTAPGCDDAIAVPPLSPVV